jgi:hypothetical protein
MLLRYTALAAGALIACATLASCISSGDSCEDDTSFSCKCVEVCSAQLDSCLQSGQHDRECSIEYEACVDGC